MTQTNDLYATVIFDFKRDKEFKGCNFVIGDSVEKMDSKEIEVREARIKFEHARIRLNMEIFTRYDVHENITTIEDAEEYLQAVILKAGLLECTILIDAANSELSLAEPIDARY